MRDLPPTQDGPIPLPPPGRGGNRDLPVMAFQTPPHPTTTRTPGISRINSAPYAVTGVWNPAGALPLSVFAARRIAVSAVKRYASGPADVLEQRRQRSLRDASHGFEGEAETGGRGELLLELGGQAVGGHHSEAGAGEEHDVRFDRSLVEAFHGFEFRDLARQIEIVGAGAQAGFGERRSLRRPSRGVLSTLLLSHSSG